MQNEREVIIIGAGCAGLTAALYASRNKLEPLVIEGASPGGQLMTTTEVENYPGFADGILGPTLILQMREQARKFGAEFLQKDAIEINLASRPFRIKLGDQTLSAQSIIIATGARANLLGLDSERLLMGRGVSTCATCDGPFFRNKKIFVIGGGDSAMEEAHFLTRFASSVTILHRRDEFRASKIMQDRALKNPKISVLWSHTLSDILGTPETGVTGVKVRNLKNNEERTIETNGVFVTIGHTPNTDLFKNQLDLDAKGYITTKNRTTLTSVEGVFAAGDVVDSRYRQAVTAAGMGCMAALDAQKYLESKE